MLKTRLNIKIPISYVDAYTIQTSMTTKSFIEQTIADKYEGKYYHGLLIQSFDKRSIRTSDMHISLDQSYIITDVDVYYTIIHQNTPMSDFIVDIITSEMTSAKYVTNSMEITALITPDDRQRWAMNNSKHTSKASYKLERGKVIDILIRGISIDMHNVQDSIVVVGEPITIDSILDFRQYYVDAHLSSYNNSSSIHEVRSSQPATIDGIIYDYSMKPLDFSALRKTIESDNIVGFYMQRFNADKYRYRELAKHYIEPLIIGKYDIKGSTKMTRKLSKAIHKQNKEMAPNMQTIWILNDPKLAEDTFINMAYGDIVIYDGSIRSLSKRIKSIDVFKPISSMSYFCIIHKQTSNNDTLRELSTRKLLYEIIRLANLIQIIKRTRMPIPKDVSEKYSKFYLEYIK